MCGVKATSKRSSCLRFGQFGLDLSEEKLLKRGLPVRLENQPFQILAALLDRPGELVSREELCANLWPDGTYVDFDEGLNTAVKKLRYALGDSPENPVFIETVPRRGYRFIAPVQKNEDGTQPLEPASGNGHRTLETPADSPATPIAKTWTPGRLIAVGVIVIAVCGLLYRALFPPTLRVTQTARLTNSSRVEPWGRITSDGSRLFFLEREGDHWNTRQISVAGGESMPFGSSPRNSKVFDVSSDKSEMLFAPFTMRTPDLPLWSMPLVGGAPRRIGDILASAATFSPDGNRIAFTNTNGAFLANRDGSGLRRLATLPDCWSIAWSPDGKILRFGQDHNGPHLWQVDSTGHDLHPFLPSWSAGEGRWTPDGSYYIFAAAKDGQLWALRESPSFPWLPQKPTQITFPPLNFGNPLPSRDGHFLYAGGGLSQEIDVVRFDPASHQFKPVLPGFNVTEVEFSPDHQWILFSNWTQLWRSRPDGSDRLQLAGPPSIPHNYFAHWSPDSRHILFEDVEDGKGTIYLVSADGGPAQQPLPAGPSRRLPNWSPDGQTIGFTVDEDDAGKPSPAPPGIYFFDLAQGRSTLLPASAGLTHTRWSPDGRFLAAVSEDTSVIKVLDLKTHRWTEVAHGTLISFPVWSADSVLYFQDLLAPGEPVYRFQPGGSAPQRAYSFEDILQSGAQRCAFWGFAPDGSLLVQVNRGGGDVYALTLSAP